MRMRGRWLALVAVVSAGCASTRVATTWRNPAAEEVPRRVLVTADAPMVSVRHKLELELANQLQKEGFQAVPFSQVVATGEKPDPKAVQEVLDKGNFNGLLVSKVVGVSEHLDYYPPSYGWGYGPYWGPYSSWGWGGYGYVTQTAHIETTLYDAREGQTPVWSGSSSTFASGADGTAMSSRDISHYSKVIASRLTDDLG